MNIRNVYIMVVSKNKFDMKKGLEHGQALRFLEKHRGKPQYRHAPHIAAKTSKVLRPLARKFGPGIQNIKSQWPHIVGEKWAKLSKPVSLRGPKGDKTLTIIAKGPACALLSADSANILFKLNQFLGEGTISKIRVQHGQIVSVNPHQKPQPTSTPLQSTLDNSGENTLQAALNRLERKVKLQK